MGFVFVDVVCGFFFSETSYAGERMGGAPSGDMKPDDKAIAVVKNVGRLPSRNSGGRMSMNCFQGHIDRSLGFTAQR